MHFEESDDDPAFRAEVRTWLEAHAALRRGEDDWSNGPSDHSPAAERDYFDRCRAWQQTRFDHGWAGITWPASVGGRGATAWQEIIFNQEMARFDVTSGFLAATIGMVGALLIAHGSDEQRARHLRRLLRGDDAWCQLFSEPGAGSDLANLSARAERDGDDFIVNGQKVWNSNAHLCDWGILIARTNFDAPKHRGITFFIVDMHTAGIEPRPLRQITGHTHFTEVFLTDVRIPAAHVVGSVDGGWGPTRTVLSSEATMIGSTTTSGNASAVIALAREFGCAGDPRVRQRLARVVTEERILGYMSDRVLSAVRTGSSAPIDASLLKVYWSETRAYRDEVAVDLLGAAGTLAGTHAPKNGYWQTQMLNRYWGTVGGGTSEVHRNMIGERALGLPAEPRVDKDAPFRTSWSAAALPEKRHSR
ncbi:MAG TPA: acyl-CoA dehydrogenase family protein [Acidimicrobiales bacterium]|nr:acyl-CoA dehydrogenase family protein [Acidimicrobiales bacterium]